MGTIGAPLQTLYQYYAGSGGISEGLSADGPAFTLNVKNITLYSGALHYFRVPPEYWCDRLRKYRAAGLNAVETYVPWNLHEPQPGVYDFGDGGTDFAEFLQLEKFLRMAQEEDLLAIVRPGPYICAEWEFGGLPSWLLKDDKVKVRTSDEKFMGYVRKYFETLLAILSVLQFTKGGPIVAFQIENEYGNVKKEGEPVDLGYLEALRDILRENGIVELLFTSDTPTNGNSGSVPGILYTANFQNNTKVELDRLQTYQKNRPSMVMEYWTGWFDHWTETHHTRTNEAYSDVLLEILNYPSSVNFYMFHGGTNWGFMNGANLLDNSTDNGGYIPDVSSYDYDAPLSEAGHYTDKYYSTKSIIAAHNKVKTKLPEMPAIQPPKAYPTVKITHRLEFDQLVQQAEHNVKNHCILPMEKLPINNDSGQSYGYLVYRKQNLDIPSNSVLKIEGRVCDTALVLIDGRLVSKIPQTVGDLSGFGWWKARDASLNLGPQSRKNATLDIVVENFGRVNFGKLDQFNQHKGLWQGDVLLGGEPLQDWKMIPLEFKRKWNAALQFEIACKTNEHGPAIYKGVLVVEDETSDTFVDMRDWTKGIIIVNGFVLSRYFSLGPQQTAYLPAPLLKKGANDIVIFEHFLANDDIKFSDKPINADGIQKPATK